MYSSHKRSPLLFLSFSALILMGLGGATLWQLQAPHAQPTPPESSATQSPRERTLPLTPEEQAREQWHGLVSSHTGAELGLYEPIKVRLVKNFVHQKALNATPAPDVIHTSPKVKGYTYWSAPNELSFKPTKGWVAEQSYQVSFTPFEALKAPQGLSPLTFQFTAHAPRFEVSPFRISLSSDGQEVTVTTEVQLDKEPNEQQRASLLKGRHDGQPVDFTWKKWSKDNEKHVYQAHVTLPRYAEPSTLRVTLDGRLIGVYNRSERSLHLPRSGAFEVTNLISVSEPSQELTVQFSEPLSDTQELKGLITSPQVKLKSEVREGQLVITPMRPVHGAITVQIAQGLRAQSGQVTQKDTEHLVSFMELKPKLKSLSTGVIAPSAEGAIFSFQSRGLKSVELTALLVREENLGQFLQVNDLEGDEEMTRVGRYLWRKRLELNVSPEELSDWHPHHIDLSELVKAHPNGLFHLEVAFSRADAVLSCPTSDATTAPRRRAPPQDQDTEDFRSSSGWDYWSWNYEDRRNPCKDAYYRSRYAGGRRINQNLISAQLGLIAKKGADERWFFVVTDLLTGQPVEGAQLQLYNYQNHELNRGESDAQGMGWVHETRVPYYVKATHGDRFGLLKIARGTALATTHFNVGGETREQGIAGAIYGERGMWRPGDELFMTFVLQDPQGRLPKGHPIEVSFTDPNGTERQRFLLRHHVKSFYPFVLKTDETDPTGSWLIQVKVGGEVFSHSVPVEMFVPNRLQVNLRLPSERLSARELPLKLTLFSRWLHGSKASKMPSKVNMYYEAAPISFESAEEFTFNDESLKRWHSTHHQLLWKGDLDQEGYANFTLTMPSVKARYGMIKAHFVSEVFEAGGGSSVEYRSALISPLNRYVGLRVPKGDHRRMLLTDTDHQILIKTLNGEGEPVDGAPLEVSLYKLSWRWWWDKSYDDLSYEVKDHTRLISRAEVNTLKGNAEWTLRVNSPQWGRYLLKVCELPDQHCASKVIYIDWPGWASESGAKEVGANLLQMELDASRYEVGQEATLRLPAMPKGRALISVEVGASLIRQRWVELSEQPLDVKIPITSDMAPNAYLNVTALQPYDRTNDRPIRLYSILPLEVRDPQTHLEPQLEMPFEVKPESKVEMKVSEKNGRPMTYTLAVVDEGLLGINAFQTPNLHKRFFKRLALSVTSWDLFDAVLGGYSGVIKRLISVGGSDALDDDDDPRRRFPPVVKFMGPFSLSAGETAHHSFTLPQYVGAVRGMLVAGEQGEERSAYGSASRKMLVRKALMVLANLPRRLGPNEELDLPVSVFATSPELQEVELFSQSSDPSSELTQRLTMSFDQPKEQEQLAFVKFKTSDKVGKQTLRFTAEAGSWVATQKVNMPITFGNPVSSTEAQRAIKPYESALIPLPSFGVEGTTSGTFEVSRLPALSLNAHLSYLIGYPHGCAEQTTSKAFPQLYLSQLRDLTGAQKAEVQKNIEAAIKKLKRYQMPQGEFAYWPGGEWSSWVNTYIGHFLLEARSLGYLVPQEMLKAWGERQVELAKMWSGDDPQGSSAEEEQAYRLLTLALAQRADLSAMNRLRQRSALSVSARWLLARAYALAGQKLAAHELIEDLDVTSLLTASKTKIDVMRGFRSPLRDLGLALLTLVELQDERTALARDQLISALNQHKGHTHELATAIISLGAWAKKLNAQGQNQAQRPDELYFSYSFADQKLQAAQSEKVTWARSLTTEELKATHVRVTNTSPQTLYVNLHRRGIPKAGQEADAQQELKLSVRYLNAQGEEVQPAQLTQGTELVAELKVSADVSYDLGQLALTYPIPSGWELENSRLSGSAQGDEAIYRDLRDDRALIYFKLTSGKEATFKVPVRATFAGRFYHPATLVEAMYVPSARAQKRGFWAEVKRP